MAITSTDLPARWCRMWSDDPALAHDLMTDDARQWSGRGPGLDPLIGPTPSEAFVAAFRAEVGPRFTPRLVVADGAERLAYTWDVATPDGAVRTGIDLDVLRDGRVAENWTLVGERRAAPDPVDEGEPTDRARLLELCHRWTVLRDGDTDAPSAVSTCSPCGTAESGRSGRSPVPGS